MSYKALTLEEQHKETQETHATIGQKGELTESLSALLWPEKHPKYSVSRLQGNASLSTARSLRRDGRSLSHSVSTQGAPLGLMNLALCLMGRLAARLWEHTDSAALCSLSPSSRLRCWDGRGLASPCGKGAQSCWDREA